MEYKWEFIPFHEGEFLLLMFYVDDIYILGNHTIGKIQWIRTKIKGRFQMRIMGLLNHFL
jgi:hypothetical protein